MQLARGESKTFTFTVTDTAGDPVDLTGHGGITFTVTDLEGATVLELSSEDVDSQIEVSEAEDEDNVFTVEITADDSDLDPGARWARCVLVTGADQTLVVVEREPFYVTGA